MRPLTLPLLALLISAPAAAKDTRSFRPLRVLGEKRFLHDAEVHALVPLAKEVRTVAGGKLWRWSKDGKLLGRRVLRGCGKNHGVGVGAFSSDGRWILVYCTGKGQHALYDARKGKRQRWAGDFGFRPAFCAGRFYGGDTLSPRGLRVLHATSGKLSIQRPKTRMGAMVCHEGKPVLLDKDGALHWLDSTGKSLTTHKGPFVRLGPGTGGVAVVKSQDTQLALADRRGVYPTTIRLGPNYLAVPGAVALPTNTRVVSLHRRYSRPPGRARMVSTKGGKVLVDTVPNVRSAIFAKDRVWLLSGWRVDGYRYRDGGSETGAVFNRAVPYYEGRIAFSSARTIWSKVGREWAGFDCRSGQLRQRGRNAKELGSKAWAQLQFGKRLHERLSKAGVDLAKVASQRLLRPNEAWLLPKLANTEVRRVLLRGKKHKKAKVATHDLGPQWFWARDAAARGRETLLVGFDTPMRWVRGRVQHNRRPQRIRLWLFGKGSVGWRKAPKGVDLVEATRVGFVPRTREIWLTSPQGNRVQIYGPALKRVVFETSIPEAAGQGMSIAFSPDGDTFAVQLENGRIHLFQR